MKIINIYERARGDVRVHRTEFERAHAHLSKRRGHVLSACNLSAREQRIFERASGFVERKSAREQGDLCASREIRARALY